MILQRLSTLIIITIAIALTACEAPTGGGVQMTRTPPPVTVQVGTKVAEYDAAMAIQSYAQQTLGTQVEVKRAGGRTGSITLPQVAQEDVNAAASLAGVTYAAALADGFASVSLGDGTISGDLTADIETASLGAFVLSRTGQMPADETAALALLQQTYPGVTGLGYTAKRAEGGGWTFQAASTEQQVDLGGGKVAVVGQAVIGGVSRGLRQGRLLVWVVVGRGTLSKALGL